ncbi:hypothetical protein LCGC14_0271280 [marine sediment metagenome]|uniref:RES domain-containing protein n=1 Tax=marine sediment metagenome TaxID=412755 RepID=A0A0F9U3U7_9ZZZZ
MHLKNARYAGPLYRALNPVYAREPLSGRGAELYGGRFNAKGVAALYTALDPAGALRESYCCDRGAPLKQDCASNGSEAQFPSNADDDVEATDY